MSKICLLLCCMVVLTFTACKKSYVQNGPDLRDSRDGQVYKTVKIGNQVWMAENLNFGTPDSYCFDDERSTCSKFGRFYTWITASGAKKEGCGLFDECNLALPVRGICPAGWHLPSKEEYESLFATVGGQATAGTALKSAFGWSDYKGKSGNGSDAYGFAALPIVRDSADFYFGYNTWFWTSTEHDYLHGNVVMLSYGYEKASLSFVSKGGTYAVRCVMD